MTIKHLEDHPHAFLDLNNVVQSIAVFAEDAHNDLEIQKFAESIGFVKAICCCTFGKPYIFDEWDESSSSWIETAPRFIEEKELTSN